MAVMGLSTQTSPFKPSFFPPYFWFCRSCPRSSALASRSFLASSKKALRSREDWILRGPDGPFSCVAEMGSNHHQLKQSTTYSTMPLGENPRSDEVDYDNSYSHWSAFIHTEMRRPTLSSRMLPSCSKQVTFDYSVGHHSTWLEESDRIRKMKMTASGNSKNVIVEAKVKKLADGSAYKSSQILSSSRSLEINDTQRKRTLQNLYGQGHTDVGQINQLTLKPPLDPRIQKPVFDAKNGGGIQKAVDESLPANFLNDRNGNLKLDNNYATEIEAQSAATDDINGTYIEPLTTKQERNVDRLRLWEKLRCIYDSVLIVDNISRAKDVVAMLTSQYRHLVHACDTEVSNIDVKQETPVDHGQIICFSIYSGPKANFGNGKSCIWIDVLDGGRGILAEFAPFFEDPSIKKVWHNYSFDNHVIENYGIKVAGFHADTMHMARLWDSSRRTEGGYSLEALTGDPSIMSKARSWPDGKLIGKISMKTIFGRRKEKKDGSEGKVIIIPPVEELQRQEREPWIGYSALDSRSTLGLYECLKNKLSNRDWYLDGRKEGTMFDFYEKYWRPFGDLLVKMETEGMLVDRSYLAHTEKVAKAEQQVAADRFRNWASKYCPDSKHMNVGSDAQLRQLFFGGIQNRKNANENLPVEREFKVPNVDQVIEQGKKTPSKYRKITLRSLGVGIETEMYTAGGWPSVSGDALKTLAGKVSADFDFASEAPESQSDDSIEELPDLVSNEFREVKEAPASGGSELKNTMEGTPIKGPDLSAYGTAYTAFGGGREGMEACHAIAALCEVCSIDSLISNFILPLQGSHVSGRNGRIHCSLNINTETGRLSARRPNLQNQPALEKDRYKIRQAFVTAPGNSLIVADYGQLELRILAHLANCKSMLDAFSAGGDFHSRTAMNMYPYIREAVEQKHVLLEWHPQPGEEKPPVPLLKDTYASERRKAKMLNFSIAYGKTTVGLARDWKVSVKEAKATVDRWYSDRQEVLKWQDKRKEEARFDRCVHTLLGRARWFPSVEYATPAQKAHIERAAINTPVQGSAADVAMCAMLEISKNSRLDELGWTLLLQVHDEVILEGPMESAEEAKAIVVDCMSKPFNGENILRVGLSVDAKCAQNWYAAK